VARRSWLSAAARFAKSGYALTTRKMPGCRATAGHLFFALPVHQVGQRELA
jgi:hypothetical protein